MSGGRLRLLLHAMDRTGPPMLALSFVEWLADRHPGIGLEVVALRGGPLIDRFVRLGPVHVLLDPREAWDNAAPAADRARVAARRAAAGPADAMLAVSVAAGQVLPFLPRPLPPLVTWSVERGLDLGLVDAPVGLVDATDRWAAGSEGTRRELSERLGGADVHLVPEFVTDPTAPDPATVAACRATLGGGGGLVVVGAGIATRRKAPDLFVEVSLALRRRVPGDHFTWIGGERDDLFHTVCAEVERLGLTDTRLIGDVEDVVPWFAAADLLVHTARLDAFPLVCLHAALAGTPVVGFAGVAALEEMFGPSAAVVPYPDVAALAGLVDSLRDERSRAALADAQGAHVRQRFTSEVGGPALLAQVEALLGAAA